MLGTEPVGLTRMKLVAVVMRDDERMSASRSWICRDVNCRPLRVELSMQIFHLKYT